MSLQLASGNVAFRLRARILKLIGAELISDDVVAVTELVKNAHDADASCVKIAFDGVAGPVGSIVISDDGCGMDLDALLGRWMEPAGSSKTGADRRVTRKKRRVLGEKGLGRFSADKLASRLELISRTKGSPTEIRAVFEWDQFDDETLMLSDVKNRWETRPAREIAKHGTVLRLTGLRSAWTERMFRRLSSRLSRLQSPFRDLDGFRITMESNEFPMYSGELRSDVLDKAPYRIDASYDGKREIAISINGAPATSHQWTEAGDLRCGPVRARIFAFDLETDAIARIGPRMEVRAWLREWSGVSLYRDGFRVWPYGEPHDDWLRLDQRRVNNPVVKLSNNQLVGFVEISGDRNPDLMDQTNREGLINNPSFEDLRKFLHSTLHTLEMHRQTIRHPVQRVLFSEGGGARNSDSIVSSLEKLARRLDPEHSSELRRLAERVKEQQDGREAQHRRLLEDYSGLAAVGQAALVFSETVRPSIEPLVETVRSTCLRLRTKLGDAASEAVWTLLESLVQSVSSITDGMNLLVPHGVEDNARRSRAIDVADELETCQHLLTHVLQARSARLAIKAKASDVVRVQMRPEVFQRLIMVLVTDALERLDGARAPRLKITVSRKEDHCEIRLMESGGKRAHLPTAIVEALDVPFSPLAPGTSPALGIARDIVAIHGGRLTWDRKGLLASLPRKRSRATV